MDSVLATDTGYLAETERRREGRLTNIIDQLLSNRNTQSFDEADKSEEKTKGKNRREVTSPPFLNADAASSASLKPSINDNRSKNESNLMTTAKSQLSSNKARRKKNSRNSGIPLADVKQERGSPDLEIETGSSRSASPYSPSSNSLTTRTPPTARTPNNAAGFFTAERLSPGNLNSTNNNNNNNKLMSQGLYMSRSCSDFMRSLAAKYNNSNPNDNSTNNLLSLLELRSSYKDLIPEEGSSQLSTFAPLGFPSLNLPLNTFIANTSPILPTKKETESTSTESLKSKKDRSKDDYFMIPSLPLCGLGPDPNAYQPMPAGLSSSPTMDLSSSQALLNIVRSASAAHNTQQQLDVYNNRVTSPTTSASLKRTAEVAAWPCHSPLDLSASMVSKRQCVETTPGDLSGRNRFRDHSSSRSSTIAPESLLKESQYLPIDRPSSRFVTDIISCYSNSRAAGGKKVATPSATNKATVAKVPIATCRTSCTAHTCSQTAAEVREWSIAHVVDFVKNIDICTEYAQTFQEHSIDGSTLTLLTEEHLITNMKMKLGPALKLRSTLAKKIGHCAICLHCLHCHGDSTATPSASPQENQDSTDAA